MRQHSWARFARRAALVVVAAVAATGLVAAPANAAVNQTFNKQSCAGWAGWNNSYGFIWAVEPVSNCLELGVRLNVRLQSLPSVTYWTPWSTIVPVSGNALVQRAWPSPGLLKVASGHYAIAAANGVRYDWTHAAA